MFVCYFLAGHASSPLGGTYWLELHNGTSPHRRPANSRSIGPQSMITPTLIAQTDYGKGDDAQYARRHLRRGLNQYAFQVIGTTVPEPGTLALLAIGLSIFAGPPAAPQAGDPVA